MIRDFGQPGGSEGNRVPGWWGNKCIRKWKKIRFTCFKKSRTEGHRNLEATPHNTWDNTS